MLKLSGELMARTGNALRAVPCISLRAVLLFFIILLPILFVPNAPARNDHTPAPARPADARTLVSGQRAEREVSPGDAHAYHLALAPDRYVRIRIEHPEIIVDGSLCPPGGRECVEFSYRRRGATPFSFISDEAGEYRLEVRSSADNEDAGTYRILVESIRPAASSDRSRVAAEREYAEGERLRADWTAESSRRALDKFRAALALWRQVGARHEEADALHSIAEVHRYLNEPHQSLRHYKAALSRRLETKDRSGEAEALNGIGAVHLALGGNQKAFDYFRRALAVSRRADDLPGIAQSLSNLGEAYYASGDMRRSLAHCSEAMALWHEVGDQKGMAFTLLIAGYAHSNLSSVESALDALNQSLHRWRRLKNRWGEAHALTAVGHLRSKLGEKQKALDLYKQAQPLFRTIGDRVGEAFILNGMGYVYDELGEKETALGYHEEALSLFKSANYLDGEAGALLRMGEVYYSLKEYARALDFFERSLAAYQAAGTRLYDPYIFRDIGMVHESMGKRETALAYYRRALEANRGSPDRRWQAYTHNNLGHVYESLGEQRRALAAYTRALSLNRATGDRFGESTTLYNLARMERDAGRLDEARAHIQEALLVAESLRAHVASQTLRASYFASAHQYYELCIDVLMRLHRQRPGEGFEVAAFEVSERARARSLVETLKEARADIHRSVDPVLLERQNALRRELSIRAERRMQLPDDPQSAAEAEALSREIDRLAIEYDEVSSQIKTSNPRYASLMQPQPLTLSEIRQLVLDDETVLVEYFLGESRSYAWTVTTTRIESYELPPRAEIEGAASRLYEILTARQETIAAGLGQSRQSAVEADAQYWEQARLVAEMMLYPLAEHLRTRRLLIVPDGALQYVPFQALPLPPGQTTGEVDSPAADGPVPLMTRFEVINQSSASSLAALRDELKGRPVAPKAVAVLADPVFESDDPRLLSPGEPETAPSPAIELTRALRDVGLRKGENSIPRLLASQAEVEAITRVADAGEVFKAIGFDASRSTAMSAELGQYRIVHFATHGVLDSKHPELSGVVLSLFDQQGQPRDGFLRLQDIYNLDLPADLVVLSACNTALGKDVKGEGLVGLTRGFMYAGSASVMASLWKVDDQATAQLMDHFYRGMLSESLPPAAALRQAQLAMWKQKRWRSPYYWAGFTLQGEYRLNSGFADSVGGSAGFRVAVAAGAFLLVVSFGCFAAVRYRRASSKRASCV